MIEVVFAGQTFGPVQDNEQWRALRSHLSGIFSAAADEGLSVSVYTPGRQWPMDITTDAFAIVVRMPNVAAALRFLQSTELRRAFGPSARSQLQRLRGCAYPIDSTTVEQSIEIAHQVVDRDVIDHAKEDVVTVCQWHQGDDTIRWHGDIERLLTNARPIRIELATDVYLK